MAFSKACFMHLCTFFWKRTERTGLENCQFLIPYWSYIHQSEHGILTALWSCIIKRILLAIQSKVAVLTGEISSKLFITIQFVPQREHVSTTKINWLMLCREMITAYHEKNTNKICG
jgi:hypothetical protein